MKKPEVAFLFLLVLFNFIANAQEDGINMDSEFKQSGKQYSTSTEGLKRKYQLQLTGGIALFSLGTTGMGIGVVLKDKTTVTGSICSGGIKVKDYKKQSKIATAFGAVGMVAGVYLVTKGIVNKRVYIQQVSISPTYSSIIVKF